MNKILVIGKNGYVSTCFQNYMKKFSDCEVTAISARDGAWKKVDFSDYDAIFNTTGLAHDSARMGTEEQFMTLNRDLPFELAQKAKNDGVKIFINMSSMIVYGETADLGVSVCIDAETIPTPAGIYGESKLAGEIALKKLADDDFSIAIIRSPLIYGEKAVDNFAKLVNFAKKTPVFPDINNQRSMIYSDNLCELVRLIVMNKAGGMYYPQQEIGISTSKLVNDIAAMSGNKLILTKIFNPIIFALSKHMIIFRKVFGNLIYKDEITNAFNGKYRVVSYIDSIRNIVK